ncbi:hypothetical protein HY633_01430 [Candidatus Uhrbacteria bacterium]|nr:hypothetical protein [Candidatus Uhrbacteria bacterium]
MSQTEPGLDGSRIASLLRPDRKPGAPSSSAAHRSLDKDRLPSRQRFAKRLEGRDVRDREPRGQRDHDVVEVGVPPHQRTARGREPPVAAVATVGPVGDQRHVRRREEARRGQILGTGSL